MKLKNGIIFNSIEALKKLNEAELPIKTAYKLKKNIEVLGKQVDFINGQRNEIINKYGKDGQIKTDDKEALEKFIKDFNEILNIEEEVEIKMLTLNELDGAKLSVNDITNISYLIKEDTEE